VSIEPKLHNVNQADRDYVRFHHKGKETAGRQYQGIQTQSCICSFSQQLFKHNTDRINPTPLYNMAQSNVVYTELFMVTVYNRKVTLYLHLSIQFLA